MADLGATEKGQEAGIDVIDAHQRDESIPSEKADILEAHEVFHDHDEGVKFRTVSWQRATIIFLKVQFAMSILAVPGSLADLGAVGGALSIVGWGVLNTCEDCLTSPTAASTDSMLADTAVVLGDFHNNHPECHSELPFAVLCKYLL